jgi:arylsulfatase
MNISRRILPLLAPAVALTAVSLPATAQQVQKPNIILIVADNFGYGDSGPYGDGGGRGMPTPNDSLDDTPRIGHQIQRHYKNRNELCD